MNKLLTLLILTLILTIQVKAQDENCSDHPWAKKNFVERLAKKMGGETNDDVKAVIDVFKKDSTAKAEHTISETDHPLIPEAWRTNDKKSCCSADIYGKVLKVTDLFVKHVSDNPSEFIRILAGITKGIGKCGKRQVKKGSDGEEHDIERMTALDLLKRIKVPSATPSDSDTDNTEEFSMTSTTTTTDDSKATENSTTNEKKFGIEYLKQYYIAKAKIIKAWVQFNRGNLLFLCRLPSAAKAALKGGVDDGSVQIAQTSWDNVTKAYSDSLKEIRTSLGGFAEVIKFAFKAFGDAKCENSAKKILTQLSKVGPCGKGKCKAFFESGIKPRPLDIRFVRFLIGKAGNNPDFEGTKLNERPKGESPFKNKLRVLETEVEPAEPVAVKDDDANAVKSIAVDADNNITAGGPYKADGTCAEAGCDDMYKPEENAQFNEQGAITSDGQPITETTGTTEQQQPSVTQEGSSSAILTFGLALVSLISLVL